MNARWERLGPLAGIVAVVLFVVGVVVLESGSPPGQDATPQEYLGYYQDDEGRILLGGVLFQLGAAFFIWFLGNLRARLAVAEGGVQRLTAIAYGGGLAAATCALLLPGPDEAGALSNEELTPDAAVVFNNLGDAFFIGAEFAAAVLLAATGLVVLGTRALPRWLGWASLVIALWLVIAPVGWAALIFAVPLWTIVVSVLLYMRPTAVEPAPAAPGP
jgi:hypothetical protein